MHSATATIAAFGKLPTHGDFVRHQASVPAVRAFDEWLQRGLFTLKQQRAAVLEESYDAAAPQAFVYRGKAANGVLLGVVKASRDSAGRTFPFVIASPRSGVGILSTAELMTQNEAFFQEAAVRVEAITAGKVGHHQVGEVVQELERIAEREAVSSEASYPEYLQQTTFRQFGDAVWDYFEDSRKYVLFKNLTETFDEGRQASSLRFGLRLPLHAEAATKSARFWMETCQRVANASLEGTTCFWSLSPAAKGDAAAAGAFMLVFFESPHPLTLGDVLGLEPPSDRVWDVQTAAEGEQAALAALALPDRYGRMLEDETLSLRDFLTQLRP